MASLAAAPVFQGGRLAAWTRWSWVAKGVIGIGATVAYLTLFNPAIVFGSLALWTVVASVAAILAAGWFRALGR